MNDAKNIHFPVSDSQIQLDESAHGKDDTRKEDVEANLPDGRFIFDFSYLKILFQAFLNTLKQEPTHNFIKCLRGLVNFEL
ncbi:hypothetical protein NLJ89_g5541 [Agrocybe chaxingu]|uniref:Uncharacterized protein n=1 Tax=Agrocybe chaxingu TaxID=84603 RepID=A0A9W8K0E1_9AGAR|nr:hypothetical protein NLJ89_g5541 [Agrocybe chaxingu]